MRIFTAVRHSVDPSRFYGDLWCRNFYPALQRLGHQVIESATDLLPTSLFMDVAGDFTREELAARGRTTERILADVRDAHRKAPIDLFFSYFYNAHFDPAGFDELRRIGIPSVNFYCNSLYQFHLVKAVAVKADHAWHAERDARMRYVNAGANPVWVQMAADPDVYRAIAVPRRNVSACFVGQRYADRDRLAARLVTNGIPLELYGAGWGSAPPSTFQEQNVATHELRRRRHIPGTIGSYVEAARTTIRSDGLAAGALRILRQATYRQQSRRLTSLLAPCVRGHASSIAAVLSAHEVCLNFSNVWADGRSGSALIPHVRLRDFEAPMCRTCYLTGHTDEIEEFYDIGKEIDTYRTAEELVDKARFYLANPEPAERLRQAGQARALRDHTWTRRFQELFRKIGLPQSVQASA